MSSPLVLALDAGTTGTRAILFDDAMRIVRSAYREIAVSFPHPGWVEQDAREIRDRSVEVLRETLSGIDPSAVAALGITNQRETVIVWDSETGEPVAPAIVWQDRRTADACGEIRKRGLEPEIRRKTGLTVDPYFSATKLRWILQNAPPGPRHVFGTVDTWMLWNLTGGERHATDPSNASRTLLFDLASGGWDDALCALFEIPPRMLPEVASTGGPFGAASATVLGTAIPIRSLVGDQQAALFGQGCYGRGNAKATIGTGLFLVCNAGNQIPVSEDLLSTVAWRRDSTTHYALEGSAFVAGSAVQWLRDGLGILATAAESETMAESVKDNGDVYFVPALSGLGTPYWDAGARGLFIGMTRGTSRAQLVRAVLEAIAYQTRELVALLEESLGTPVVELRVDGGATRNGFLMRFLAEVLDIPVSRSEMADLTAAGAAGIAGVAAGVWASPADFARRLGPPRVFLPSGVRRDRELARWKDAVSRSRSWAS